MAGKQIPYPIKIVLGWTLNCGCIMVEEHGQNPINVRKTIGSTIPYHPLKFTIFMGGLWVYDTVLLTFFQYGGTMDFPGRTSPGFYIANDSLVQDLWEQNSFVPRLEKDWGFE